MNRNERKSKITSYKLLGISWYNCWLEELGNGNGNGNGNEMAGKWQYDLRSRAEFE